MKRPFDKSEEAEVRRMRAFRESDISGVGLNALAPRGGGGVGEETPAGGGVDRGGGLIGANGGGVLEGEEYGEKR